MGSNELLGVCWGVLLLAGCGGRANFSTDAGNAGGAETIPPTGAFTASDFYAPSVTLGDQEQVSTSVGLHCKARPEGARGQCYRVELAEGGQRWAGVSWVFPSDNEGRAVGLPIPFEQLTQLSFQAAVESGSSSFDAQVGCMNGQSTVPPSPNGDALCLSASFDATTDWQRVTIPLHHPELPSEPTVDDLIGGLTITTRFQEGDVSPRVLYVDDIVFE